MLSNLFDFDLSDILSLTLGFVLGAFWKPLKVMAYNRSHEDKRKIPMPAAKHVFIAFIAVAILWSLWTTASTQSEIKRVNTQAAQCYSQFYQALTANRDINDKIAKATDDIEKLQDSDRDALHQFILKLFNVPPEIQATPPDSEQRKNYGYSATAEYIAALESNNQKRAELSAQKEQLITQRKPYPEPTCGRIG